MGTGGWRRAVIGDWQTRASLRSPSPFEQMRWDKIDHCVRAVMARGTIPQGYMGKIKVDRASVREWFDANIGSAHRGEPWRDAA